MILRFYVILNNTCHPYVCLVKYVELFVFVLKGKKDIVNKILLYLLNMRCNIYRIQDLNRHLEKFGNLVCIDESLR